MEGRLAFVISYFRSLRPSRPSVQNRIVFTLPILLTLVGCPSANAPSDDGNDLELAVVEIAFPDGDPAVPPELGGPGFLPSADSKWDTNADFPSEGDPQAVKGGAVRYWMRFPPTVRIVGKDSGTSATTVIRDLCYESLLDRHGDTLDYIPRLATHWSISDNGQTYRYRINPRAHWADGRPVVAADVVSTWRLLMNKGILQPVQQVIFGKFDDPVAVSKYIVEVRCHDDSPSNFQAFSGMPILPAHEIGDIEAADFLADFQFRAVTGSGPYSLGEADIRPGRSLTFRQRAGYWGEGERFAVGQYNFDIVRLVSTEDSVLGLEKTKKGEIDIYRIGKAKDWAVDLPRLDQVRRGLLVLKQIDNDEPVGVSGIVINMRDAPLDDVRIRKALCHLYNRELLIEKLFYDSYVPLDSYFPDSDFANPDNELIRYDPQKAADLLADAGWLQRDAYGYLVKDGQRLRLEVLYNSKAVERYLSVFQEDCRKAGIEIRLQQLTRASRVQLTYNTRQFQLSMQGWSGEIDPHPASVWHSSLADQRNNHNLTGFKSERVDELCERLESIDDPDERTAVLREIDGLIFAEHPCILGWSTGYVRLAYWNKFGHPRWYLGRTASAESVLRTWWIDEAKAAALKEAKANPEITLDPGPQEVLYWKERGE